MKKKLLFLILLSFITLAGRAQVKPGLGTAAGFTLLAGTGVANSGNTEVDGNLGIAPATSLTGFPPGTIRGATHIANATAISAQASLTTAYNSAAAQTATQSFTDQQNLGGKTFKPGVYKFNNNTALTGTLTLDSNGNPDAVFIFQINGDFTAANNAVITFLESAKPRVGNIFWQINGTVSIGAGSSFRGTIMADKTITMMTGATIQGRLLSRTGNVNLTNNLITIPTDLAVTKTKSAGIKAPDLYSVGENITFSITARNLGPVDRANVRVSDVLPAGLTYVSSTTTNGTTYDPATSLWVINNLANGSTETLSIVTRINSGSSDFIVNTATIASDGFDEIIENNQATVNVCVSPSDPGVISGPVSVCINSTGNIYSVTPVSGARSYNWTVPSGWTITNGQNTASITVTAGSNGGQVTVSAENVCAVSSLSRKDIQASQVLPPMPGAITANPATANVCAGQTGFTYSIAPVTDASSYVWTVPSGWAITAGQGTTAITVTAGTTAGNISVSAVNGCGTSPARAFAVTASTTPPAQPAAITGNLAPCIGVSATYSVSATSGINTYSWTVPAGWTIASGQGTNTITVIAGPNAGNIEVTAANGCGSSTTARLAVTSITNAAPGNITGASAPCATSTGNTYNIAAVPGANSYTWTVPNGWTITEGQGTTNIKVTAGNNAGNITVTAFNDCGASATKALAVAPTNKPDAPQAITGTTSQPCATQTNLTYSIAAVAGATSYTWTVPAGWNIVSGQSTSAITVSAGSSAGNISVAAVNNCGSSAVVNLAVTPTTTVPAEPLNITGKDNPCISEANVTYSVNAVTGATGYTWSVPVGWIIIEGQGTTSIKVTAGSNAGDIMVVAKNNCGNSTVKALPVVVSTAPSPSPGAITGSQLQPCSGETNITYSVGPVSRATSYLWIIPAGWTITAGQGTTAISVTAGNLPGKISVAAVNGCGTSPASELNVTPVTSVPVAPITITGTTIPCVGQNNLTYTITEVANANSYVWNVPAGWSITAGQGTASITVMAGTQPGDISVVARNNCGSSTAKIQAVNVSSVAPVMPGAITGNTNLCAGQTGITYSVLPISGATSYIWTVPGGWNITAGQGTNAIVVTSGSTAGTISVKTTNNCGTSGAREINVAPTSNAPANPGVIATTSTAVCAGQTGIIYSVQPVAGATTYNWSVPTGWNITSGQGTNSITVTGGSTAGAVSLIAFNNCGASPVASLAVNPGSLPTTPIAISGGVAPCASTSGNTFSIAAVPGATSYTWTVPSGWAITAGEGSTAITVMAGAGKGTISVAAVNSCGASEAASINVGSANGVPGLPGIITGKSSVCASVADLTYSVSAVENASNYIWSVPTGWVITGGQGTSTLTVTASSSPGTISVIAENGCGFSTASILPVSVTGSAPPVPLAITGVTTVCANQDEVEYSIGGVNGATTYTWTVPTGWTIISGQGTTAVKVKTGTVSGSVKVAAGNGCGASTAQTLAVNITNGPEKPLAIDGILNQCAGTTGSLYKIKPVDGASSYTWIVPADWTITAGQGTTTITVTAGKESGNISVKAVNNCGTSAAHTVAVTSATTPSPAPGRIRTSQVLACIGQNDINYSVDAISNASSYIWVVPTDWIITGGQGTTSITVTAGTQAGSVSVKALNGCGESLSSSLSVNPGQTPAVEVGAIKGEPNVCIGTKSLIYAIDPVAGATTYTWTVPAGWTITAGQNTNAITVAVGSTAGVISVTAASSCATSFPSNLEVKVNPAPPALSEIKEASSSCTGLSYSVAAVTGVTGYTWEVPAGWTITNGQGTTTINVTAPEGSGSGTIKVAAVTGSCSSAPVTLEADPGRSKSNLTIANVFSPNGDGTNDKWEIPNIQNFDDNDLVIINRWGNEVYKTKAYQNNWDGGNLSAGTYFYVLKVKECNGAYKTYKGYVMIMR